MRKITTLDEIQTIPDAALREHIWNRTSEMMTEYAVNSLEEIGCIVLLDADESPKGSDTRHYRRYTPSRRSRGVCRWTL